MLVRFVRCWAATTTAVPAATYCSTGYVVASCDAAYAYVSTDHGHTKDVDPVNFDGII